jgi:hypothetical protein
LWRWEADLAVEGKRACASGYLKTDAEAFGPLDYIRRYLAEFPDFLAFHFLTLVCFAFSGMNDNAYNVYKPSVWGDFWWFVIRFIKVISLIIHGGKMEFIPIRIFKEDHVRLSSRGQKGQHFAEIVHEALNRLEELELSAASGLQAAEESKQPAVEPKKEEVFDDDKPYG